MSEFFQDKNGRPVQVGDTLIWEAEIGTVHALVTRYADLSEVNPEDAFGMPESWQRVIMVRLPHTEVWIFAHQALQMESEPPQ